MASPFYTKILQIKKITCQLCTQENYLHYIFFCYNKQFLEIQHYLCPFSTGLVGRGERKRNYNNKY